MNEIHLWEISLIKSLQTYRNEALDLFFTSMNFLDTNPYYFLVIPIIWLGYDWKWGARLLFLLMLAQILCQDLKELFAQPRPFDMDPSLAVIKVKGYGLPSGAALASSCLMGYLALNWKTVLGWLFAGTYVLLMCFSRVYLGVHFITDIILGVLLGSLLGWIGYCDIPRLEKWIQTQSKLRLALTGTFVPLIVLIPHINAYGVQAATLLIAGGLGLLAASKWGILLPPPSSVGKGTVRAIIAVAGILAIFCLESVMKEYFHAYFIIFIRAFLAVFWITLAGPLVCRVLKVA